MTSTRGTAAAELRSYIERIERIAADRRDLGDDMRAVFAEAKAAGFDTKAIRRIIKRRDKDPAEVAEEDTIFATYMAVIGMTVDPPLHAAVAAMGIDTAARDDIIAALQLLVPTNGEIIAKVGGKPLRIWRDEAGTAHAAEYIEPKMAPAEKSGRSLKKPAAVLSLVPKDHIKAAADAAERRAADKARRDRAGDDDGDDAEVDVDADEPEPVS
ncbi:MAG: DUF2312 domain-containing protein [Rhizobiales bacterium]|nr:DUF2312 domain-containing protein [Hyphomicrobiales bacterium]